MKSPKTTTFTKRDDWIQHLALRHSFAPEWKGLDCPLCCQHIDQGKTSILRHIESHLEEISLASLPALLEPGDRAVEAELDQPDSKDLPTSTNETGGDQNKNETGGGEGNTQQLVAGKGHEGVQMSARDLGELAATWEQQQRQQFQEHPMAGMITRGLGSFIQPVPVDPPAPDDDGPPFYK